MSRPSPIVSAALSEKEHMAHEPPVLRFHCDFSDETDDIVLRSSDGVHFRVHSVLLRKASTVFSDMLALPQPPPEAPPSSDTTIISLDEPQNILERGLRLITSSLLLNTFPDITSLIELASFCDKYELHGCLVPLRLLSQSPRFASESPLKLYKLACLYGWDEVIDDIAIRCIEENPSASNIVEALEGLELRHYARLVDLSRRRIAQFELEIGQRDNFPCTVRRNWTGRGVPTVCSSCEQNFKNGAWMALRYRAIIQFHERPGLTPFASNSFDVEIDVLNCSKVCDSHGKLDSTNILPHLERIVASLPKI